MRKPILILGHNDATQFIDIYNQYARVFDPHQFEVTIAYLTGEPSDMVKHRTLADHVLFLNIPKQKLRTLKISAIKQLLMLCREKKFQIVICHRYKPSYIMMWVAQFYKIPALICVMHELKTMASFNRQLLIACLRRNNMLFAGVSDAVRNDMQKDLWCVPKNRIVTLYNMIDIPLTEPQLLTRSQAREALNIPEDAFVFGNIARLAPNKDQASLIQAFSLIKPYCPQAKLIFIGTGSLMDRLKEQVILTGLAEHVIFTGFLPNGFQYMKAFDVFVLSSIQEAFGRVLLEAMIAKIPIIASRTHGIPEVVGDAGLLVQPKDVIGFTSAMKTLYEQSPKARENLGEKGYARVKDYFSIPVFHNQFWELPLLHSFKE